MPSKGAKSAAKKRHNGLRTRAPTTQAPLQVMRRTLRSRGGVSSPAVSM